MTDYVLVCQGTLNVSVSPPTCSGAWIGIDVVSFTTTFDPNLLDASAVVSAFGSGFIVMGVPLLVIFAGRLVLSVIKGDSDD